MKRQIALVLVCVLLITAFTGCAGRSSSPVAEPSAEYARIFTEHGIIENPRNFADLKYSTV